MKAISQKSAIQDAGHIIGALDALVNHIWEWNHVKPGTALVINQEQMRQIVGDTLTRAKRLRSYVRRARA